MTRETDVLGAQVDRVMNTRGVEARRAEDVLALQRAARKGGSRAVLGWLAQRSLADVLLISATGVVLSSGRRLQHVTDETIRAAVQRGVRELSRRRAGSMAVHAHGHALFFYPLDCAGEPVAPVLAAVGPHPDAAGLAPLLADAASTLSLCWKAEHAERLRLRLESAENRTREVVLHLLMSGHMTAARQVSDALQPRLPDTIRVCLIEGTPEVRGEIAASLTARVPDAWIVACPVYDAHLIVLTPAADGASAVGAPPLERIAMTVEACRVGMSERVALQDTATGYAQAFHALAAARHRTDRCATFASSPDLALALGPAAAGWAEHFLAPLRAHSAKRSQDPGSRELLATAASWLSFSSQATKHLKIHRNTLSARLKHIARQLDLDLSRLADQSALALALRALPMTNAVGTAARPVPPNNVSIGHLDDLLAQPAVTRWARHQFQPLTTSDQSSDLAQTLEVWLQHDGHIEAAATVLSLSSTAVRKRLARTEAILQRSLLRPPTARHELWLAQRALSLTSPTHDYRVF
ncbi:helix-turn-helix domain-containing protein [Streptomyces sp. NPDC056402]|uniref:helix-turn-helix domain-containing protein n=1 Tax=Streptomyces sp. NPDC056402 TaxID=3345810 RepID=UPI0035D5F013